MSFIDDSRHESGQIVEHQRLQWLWERSICTSIGSEIIAGKMGESRTDVYQTTGLLLDIGIYFLLFNFPKEYNAILDRWQSEGGNLVELETEAIGVDHATVGRQLAKKWNLGVDLENAIFSHHSSDDCSDAQTSAKIFRLANLASAVLFEDRHITGLERAIRFAQENCRFERANFIDELQRITLIADQKAMRISIQPDPALSYVELLRNVNSELGRATLTYEQMVRELEIAMSKAELLAQKLEDANRKLRDAANYDPLTRIHNRRFFEEFLNWNFNRSQRYNTTLGCMMLDIDHFKRVNDTYGHLAGDRVLQGVAEALKGNLRNTDIVARYGGEEFVVLLPDTKAASVYLTALKLNNAVRKIQFSLPEGELNVTISIGFSAYSPSEMPDVTTPMEIVKIADQNMYIAKEAGRDRVSPVLAVE